MTNEDGYCLAVESRVSVSSYLGLVRWMYLNLGVDVHSMTRVKSVHFKRHCVTYLATKS